MESFKNEHIFANKTMGKAPKRLNNQRVIFHALKKF